MIIQGDSLEEVSKMESNSVDLFLTDVPYGIGSKLYIRPDGGIDYMKSTDFMERWQQPDGDYWKKWFTEVKRVLKYGGKCVVFGIDNQIVVWQYYALVAGLQQNQSLYWLYVDSMPKGHRTNRATQRRFGKESETCKKYDGYYNGARPFKQITETIMVFQKEHKYGGCIDDIVAYENGDPEIIPSCVNVDGNVLPVKDLERLNRGEARNSPRFSGKYNHGKIEFEKKGYQRPKRNGAFPTTVIVDDESMETLGEQGIVDPHEKFFCAYDEAEHHPMLYVRKPRGKDRNEHAEKTEVTAIKDGEEVTVEVTNSHLTVKPVALMTRLIRLFMPPVKQYKVVDPFVGSGTTILAGLDIEGVEVIGIEIDPEYVELAHKKINARNERLTLF
jgi:DNA modification methylase